MDMLFGTFASKSLLIVRVVLGVIFLAHGAQKVCGCFGGPGLRGVIGYFRSALGVPAPLTVLAAFTEFLGGLAMIVGFLARPARLRDEPGPDRHGAGRSRGRGGLPLDRPVAPALVGGSRLGRHA
jgi:hypothetical protein